MDNVSMVNAIISWYVEILEVALPVSVTIGLVNIVLNMLCSAFFGGKLQIGGKW